MSKKSKGDTEHIQSPEELARQREQDAIVIPKGQSKLKTFVIWGLMIFVLFIFSVGGAFQDTLSCSGDPNSTHLSWKGFDGTPHALDVQEFYSKKQEYGRLRGIYPALGPGVQDIDVNKDVDVARMIVMADIARGAGVRVPDDVLRDTINFLPTLLFRTGQWPGGYKGWVSSQRGLTTSGFEKTLRDVLVVQRFRRLLSLGTGAVDHDLLVTRWQSTRTEYSFDYVEARTADFEPEVLDTLPDTVALNAWLLALPANEQSVFHSPERWNAQFAVLPTPMEEGAGALLLAAYPRPADEEAGLKALDYYNSFMGTRFERPQEEEAADDGNTEDEEATTDEVTVEEPDPIPDTPFFSFDEVETICLVEAPLYYSLVDWHLDVQVRGAGGEEIDLASECERLGLTMVPDDSPRSLQEWNEFDAEWAGENLGNTMRFTQAGSFGASLRVSDGGFFASRVTERIPRALPDFPGIEADVAAAWIKDAAANRAWYTLDGIRDRVGDRRPDVPFEPKTTPEQFASAASNAGSHAQKDFTVHHRAFEEKNIIPKPGEETPPIESFLRFNPQLFSAEEGRVWEPTESLDSESVFLVLVGPTRPADVSKMQPQDLAFHRSQMAQESIRSFFSSTFDFESPESIAFLEEHFDYYLDSGEEDEGSGG